MPMFVIRPTTVCARSSVCIALLLAACSFPEYDVAPNALLGGGGSGAALGTGAGVAAGAGQPSCSSGDCGSGEPAAPNCHDRLKNGDETGVDCGGECASCNLGQVGCSPGHADCNGDEEDGCEVDLQQDPAHCGACTTTCGNEHASESRCVSGTCQPTCEPGFADCGTGERGCATPLGTDDDCTKCGDSCAANAPYCASSGCASFRSIEVASASPNGMQAWNGTGSAPIVDVRHTPQYDKGQSRIVLVGLAASGTGAGPFSVTYDDQPMLRAVELEHESRQTYAAIYYVLDDAIPRAGVAAQVRAEFHESAWWGFGGLDVLEAANVQQKKPLLTGSSVGAVCDGQATRGVGLTFDAPGSLVYGVLSVRHALAPPTVLSAPLVTQAWSQSVSNGGDPHSGSAAWVIDDDTRALQWGLNGCDTTASVGVVLERLHVD